MKFYITLRNNNYFTVQAESLKALEDTIWPSYEHYEAGDPIPVPYSFVRLKTPENKDVLLRVEHISSIEEI